MALCLTFFACTGTPQTDDSDTDVDIQLPTLYDFDSRFDGQSSVSYSGQVFRQVLIDDLKTHIGGLTARIEDGLWFPVAGDVTDEVAFFMNFDSETSGEVSLLKITEPLSVQTTYNDLSTGKNLWGKLAGNDVIGQHKDWSTQFAGWGAEGSTSPESLIRSWISTLDAQAVAFADGDSPLGPTGEPVPEVFITPLGQDLRQLIQKFSRVAIAFSQGADDYLDDDIEGKGLLSAHGVASEGENHSALEHGWDEGFGYFGAAVSYGVWSDIQIQAAAVDENEDGAIDLTTEQCFGHAINAAKRDLGAAEGSDPTDFTAEAWAGFALGRHLLARVQGELNAEELHQLKVHRDQAVSAWERVIAANVVHYINELIVDGATIGTETYDFADHAKHWSEMKGFALGLQFNPRSPLTDTQFSSLHDALGTAPVLLAGELLEAYTDDLIQARALLGETYGFSDANLGDENGENGW